MRHAKKSFAFALYALIEITIRNLSGQSQPGSVQAPVIPKTWDDQAIATLEVPLANPVGSPKHVSADYYYRIPVAPIYKSYPVYAPSSRAARLHGLAQGARARDPLG
jgi:hypothetical protein